MNEREFFATMLGRAAMAGIAMMVALVVLAIGLPTIPAAPPSDHGWQQVELA